MKKLLSILLVMFFAITSSAQAPFTTYRPVIVPEQSYSLPELSFPDPLEDLIRRDAAEARAKAQAMEIVSSDIITADGFNLISESFSPLKIKIIQRRNGLKQFICLGIKKNGRWGSCEQEIVSLDAIYKNTTKESEKSAILELMEYGNFLLIINPNTEVYIIK